MRPSEVMGSIGGRLEASRPVIASSRMGGCGTSAIHHKQSVTNVIGWSRSSRGAVLEERANENVEDLRGRE
ncbi:MAG TPA: hypothetical protein VMG31_03335 [Verrucomicrobiae bacterium]|nr:hypothetical protein [Verrucomicrobiae bacterium]